MKNIALVLSCEHAVNTVPETYKTLFAPYQHLLNSHKGIDFGSLTVAKVFASFFKCDFVHAHATRLLIDCNRTLGHPNCFSEITKPLPKNEKELIIQLFYQPYRKKVENYINNHIQQGKQVFHLSIHSFTPIFNDFERNTDLGFLYDPKRAAEKSLARAWQQRIKPLNQQLRVRMNSPYHGTADGFTTGLRKRLADQDYIGVELEINQKLTTDLVFLNYLAELLTQTLQALLKNKQ